METLNKQQLDQIIEKTLLINKIDDFIETMDQDDIIFHILRSWASNLEDIIENVEKDETTDQLKDCLRYTHESINDGLPEYDLYDCGTVSPIQILAMIEKNGANLRPLTSTIESNLENQRWDIKTELMELLKNNKINTSAELDQILRKNDINYILKRDVINLIDDYINEL